MRNVIAIGYAVLITVVTMGMLQARQWAYRSMTSAGAQDEWELFRGDVVMMNEASPVRRRVPKSVEPPALVLMRDHFATCTFVAILLSSALYATCAFFAVGVLRGSPPVGGLGGGHDKRQRDEGDHPSGDSGND